MKSKEFLVSIFKEAILGGREEGLDGLFDLLDECADFAEFEQLIRSACSDLAQALIDAVKEED